MPDASFTDVLKAPNDSWKVPSGLSVAETQFALEALRAASFPRGGGVLSPPLTTAPPNTVSLVRSGLDLDIATIAGERFVPPATKSLGPFVDSIGIQHWIDLFPVASSFTIESSTKGVLAKVVSTVSPPTELGAGSLWISTSALGLVGSGFIGMGFLKGTSHVVGTLQSQSGKLTIAPGVTLTLVLTLAPVSAAGGSPGIGADATAISLRLPPHVTLEFTANGVLVSAFDDASATVYGTGFTCTRAALPPQRIVAGSEFVVFPCEISIPTFTVTTCASTDVAFAGTAAILKPSGWAFPVVSSAERLSGEAAGTGLLALALDTGLSLAIPEQLARVALAKPHLLVGPGTIVVTGTFAADISQRFALWDAAPGDPRVIPAPARAGSDVRLRAKRGAPFVATVSANAEVLVETVRVTANLDRPLGADGRRIPFVIDNGFAALGRLSTGEVITIVATAPNATIAAGAIALENALLRCGPARSFILHGKRTGPRITGALRITLDVDLLLPTLPDPYAASFTTIQSDQPKRRLLAVVMWPSGIPKLSFTLDTPMGTPGATAGALLATTDATGGFVLLDLSSAADQFGVQVFSNRTAAGATIAGLNLVAPQGHVAIYALPGISWEPVVDDRSGDWYAASSNDDGPPTRFVSNSVALVSVEPKAALPAFIAAAQSDDVTGAFTLPFGLVARLQADATTAPGAARPTFTLVPSTYSRDVVAALQIAIRAGITPPPGAPTRALPGSTTTNAGVPLTPPTVNFGAEILGANEIVNGAFDSLSAAKFFDPQFSAGRATAEIPVVRIDISGYGTSMFSDWRNPDITVVGVVRSRFDVLVGRTAYELVQLQSAIVPWSERITRTIIFERFDSGLIVRHDSGWKGTDDARFELLNSDQVLAGGLDRLTAIHTIVPTGGAPITFTSPDVPDPTPPGALRSITFVPVTFDADAVLAAGVSGIASGKSSRTIAATRIVGYVQQTVGKAASAREIVVLMQLAKARGIALDGHAGAIVNVGDPATGADPKFTMNVSSFRADVTNANVAGRTYPAIAVALHGVPRLPRDGSWSIGRRAVTAQAPTAVDPSAPIPLVRALPSAGPPEWRLLDPADALSVANPQMLYGLLQTAGTSKTFYEHLIVDPAGRELGFDPAHLPNLADVGALLGATDLFPNLGNVLKIPSSTADSFKLARDGFKKTFSWQIADPDRELFKLGVIRLVLSYHAKDASPTKASLVLDPTGSPRFALALEGLTFAAYVDGISSDPLLQIHGNFSASDSAAPGFNGIDVDYGSALDLIKKIISGLTELVTALGGDVDLDIGFSGSQLTVHQGFVLPTIPLGLGEVRDVGIDLGLSIDIPKSAKFNVGIGGRHESDDASGLKLKPFTWIVDPLTGNGAISLGVSDGDLAVYIEAGIGVALAIDLAVASGSASITLELAISTDQKPFVLAITLIGQADVDVLDGLASASLTLSAAIAIHPDFPPSSLLPNGVDLTAMVAVGIHLSIAWVVSVDFDGSWQFSQHVPLHLP